MDTIQTNEKITGLAHRQASFLTQELATNHLTWVEVSKSALFHNIAQYHSLVSPEVVFMPVIKSNAYGHGMLEIAQLLQENELVDALAVVSLSEALILRMNGITKKIVVLSIIDTDIEQAVLHNIDLVIFDELVAQKLNILAQKYQTKASVHIKIDTGLSRLGFLAAHAPDIVERINNLSNIEIVGIFTHFANSESDDDSFVQLQLTQFSNLISVLEKRGISIPLKHTTCSAALGAYQKTHGTLVRFGIGLYGLWPSLENKQKTTEQYPDFNLQPVLQWKTRIAQIKTICAGSFVGYDLTFKTKRETKIALLPVGYWDGIARSFSNNGAVVIKDTVAPIIGRVAMNLCMVDVTEIIDVNVNDEVLLLGNHVAVTADALAQRIGTINYEVVTHINPLLKRIITF
jgi:alanine racemase